MSGQFERETGPDFMSSKWEYQRVPEKLVELLASRGFAISTSFWKLDKDRRSSYSSIAINASPNARNAWSKIVMTAEYQVLEALDLGFWPGGSRFGTYYDALEKTYWDKREQRRFLALYEYNLQRKRGASEDWAREKARDIDPTTNVDEMRESIGGQLELLVEKIIDQSRESVKATQV